MTTSMNILHGILILTLSACLKPSDCEKVIPPMILHNTIKNDNNNIHPILTCPASGSNIKTYKWRLPNNSTMNTGTNSSFSPQMCGVHQCFVTNAAGTDVSNHIVVTGCSSTSHTASESIVDRRQGQYLVLNCTTPFDHPFRNHKKSWKFIKSANINKPISNNSKTFISGDGTLILLRLSTDDSGEYVCEAFNKSAMMKVDIAKYYVNVNSEDGSTGNENQGLVYSSSDIDALETSSFSLFCIFAESNFSNQSSVLWQVSSAKGSSISLENESKIFKNVQVNDSGNVTCSWKGAHSRVISLRVRALPQCSEKFTSQNITRGQDVTFTCLDSQHHHHHLSHFHFQWFVNGSHVWEFDNRNSITFPHVSSSFVATVNISNGLQNRFHSAYAMVDDSTTSTSTTSTTATAATSTISTTTISTTRVLLTTRKLVTSFPPTIKTTDVEVTVVTRPTPVDYKFSSPDKLTTTNLETTPVPKSTQNSIVYVVVGVLAAVCLIIAIVTCYCCCKRKLSRKRKQEPENSVPAPSVEALVLANLANDVQPQAPQVPPPNNQLVNPRQNIIADDDSMSLRSSDSGFSDPTNEPLLKSNEQLNNENKSKSDSEREGLNERPAMLLSAGVC